MNDNDRIKEVCGLLKDELLDNGFLYGFYLNDKRVVPDISLGFDKEFARLLTTEYRVQSPEVTRREKVATCLDAVVVMKDILKLKNIDSTIWMIYKKEKHKVHSVLTFEISDKVVYLELTPQSGKANYGKEILFDSVKDFEDYWINQGYILKNIDALCIPGVNPSFFTDMLK